MEATKEEAGFLEKIRPPRLEDAGLEDCALPPDSIKEAFLKAASAVSSRVASVLSGDESEGECVNDPLPGETIPPPADDLVGSKAVGEAPGGCANEKGGSLIGDEYGGADLVGSDIPEAEEDVIVSPPAEGGERPCVDGVRGLKTGKKKKSEEGEGPTLVEGYLV